MIFISSLNYGGAEKQAVIDANLLSEKHNVFIATFNSGPLKKILLPNVKYIEFDKKGYISTALRIRRFIKIQNIEIIHSLLFAPMTLTALAALFSKVCVIWHFHSHEYDIPLKSKINYFLLSRSPKVSKILFVNHELKIYLSQRFFFPIRKTGIFYNSSDSIQYLKKKNRNSIIKIGYIGRLIELKRVEYFIELSIFLLKNNIHDFEIHIVGDGSEKKKLQQLMMKNDIKDHIIFHGFQSDIKKYYSFFDVFINPSREECLSIATIDAGMHGIPSIAFDVGGNNEIIEHNKTGFIVNTKTELFEKTVLLIQKKELRDSLGENAKEYCRDKFSHERHLKQLGTIYKECLSTI